MNDCDYDSMRPFLVLFETLLTTDDPLFVERRDGWLRRFLQIMIQNSSYYKWMETCFEFTFKLVDRYPFIWSWFKANTAAWDHLKEWAAANKKAPHPSQPNSNGVRLFKSRKNLSIQSIQQFSEPMAISMNWLNASYRLKKMKEMINDCLPDAS